MLVGAASSFIAAYATGNLWIGLVVGMIAGCVTGLIMAYASVTLSANQVLTGLAILFLGTGLSTVLIWLAGIQNLARINTFEVIPIPILADIPYIGPILFQHSILVYLAFLSIPIFWFVLYRTTFGHKIRSVGENPRAAETYGVNVRLVRYLCIMFGSSMAGLGGAFLVASYVGSFADGMTGGVGWIAVSIVIFAGWSVKGVLAGSLFFGVAQALALNMQAFGVAIPYRFLMMTPYILTIISLVVLRRGRKSMPAALTKPYSKRENV